MKTAHTTRGSFALRCSFTAFKLQGIDVCCGLDYFQVGRWKLIISFSLVCQACSCFRWGICSIHDERWVTDVSCCAYHLGAFRFFYAPVSFAYVFSIVEILNYCHAARYQHPNQFVPIISSTQQVCINLVACVICGVYFGLLFSLMELGQENNPVAIHRDRLYTFPVGMIFGGLVGVANYFSAVRSSTYDPLDINMAWGFEMVRQSEWKIRRARLFCKFSKFTNHLEMEEKSSMHSMVYY